MYLWNKVILMNLKKIIFATGCFLLLFSCARRETLPNLEDRDRSAAKPPAYVQKAWNARYEYDQDRRRLIPIYAGNRWGSVQQYKEDGSLEYLDWWVKDVKSEDLDPSPEMDFPFLLDEDGNMTVLRTVSDSEQNKSDADELPAQDEESVLEQINQDDPASEPTDEIFPFSPF